MILMLNVCFGLYGCLSYASKIGKVRLPVLYLHSPKESCKQKLELKNRRTRYKKMLFQFANTYNTHVYTYMYIDVRTDIHTYMHT